MAKVIHNNTIAEVPDSDVDVELKRPESLFSTNVNLIPMPSAVQVSRLFYGARFFNQALPLKDGQAALVQNARSDGNSFDYEAGKRSGALRAKLDGVVTAVTPKLITLTDKEGKVYKKHLYNRFKFNRKTSITQTPLVEVGATVRKGDLLAKSNFTDTHGDLAMGRNATIALVPYKGHSMDDAVVISRPFARALTSQHTYNEDHELREDEKTGKAHYTSLFPKEFTSKQLDKLTEDGVPKVGTVLRKDDPILLATGARRINSTAAQTGRLSKALAQTRTSLAKVWDHDDPGTVTHVAKTPKGWSVVIESESPAREGDKIVLRAGQKGIISRIIDEKDMPRTKAGKKIDVLLNPLGIPSRVNNELIYELALGKVAQKEGKKVVVPPFPEEGTTWNDFVTSKLKAAGLEEQEEIYDPKLDSYLESPVTVGVGHVLKLHHVVDSKLSHRSTGAYDVDQQPLKGGSEAAQAKRLSGLDTAALMSASAYNNIREGATLRGQQNDEYWRALRAGHSPAPPGRPFVWDKFRALLTGAGLHTHEDLKTGELRISPLTDRHLHENKPIKVESGDLVDARTLQPVRGGLFDEGLVGSNKWGYIELPEHTPNPAFEGNIAKLLGITQKDLEAILAGEKELPDAIKQKLKIPTY